MSKIRDNDLRANAAFRSIDGLCLILVLLGCQRSSPPHQKNDPPSQSRIAKASPTATTSRGLQPRDNSSRDASAALNTESELPEVFGYADLFDDGLPTILHKVYSPTRRRLLVLLEHSPWLIDLELLDDNQSIHLSWHDSAAEICRSSDTDNDGKTTWSELVANDDLPFARDELQGRNDLAMVTSAYDANSNDQVEPLELVRFINRNVGGQEFVTVSGENSPSQSRREVFDWLDRNDDEILDQEELQNCRQRLTMRDANGDRLLAREDFNAVSAGMAITRPRRAARKAAESKIFVMQAASSSFNDDSVSRLPSEWESILYALEKSYSYGDPLSAGDLPTEFADLDGNKDGYIDLIELPRISDMAPQAVARIELRTDGSPHISVSTDPGSTFETTRIRPDRWSVNDERFSLAFACVDDLATKMRELDSNTVADALGRLRLFVSLQTSTADLFSLVDADDSGMLDSSEIAAANETLRALDKNEDDRIEVRELNSSKTLFIRRQTFTDGSETNPPTVPAIGRREDAGPVWFDQMDSNRDRYIQSSEFLGSSAQFESLDANADGRISKSELSDIAP